MADEDQGRVGQAMDAAKAVKQVEQVAKAGRAAMLLANPWVWGAGVVALVFLVATVIIGLVLVGSAPASGGTGQAPAAGGTADCGKPTGTPKDIIDKLILPIAHTIAFKDITPESVKAANDAHSVSTTSGNTSEHKGPPEVAWAADISNTGATAEDESSMTPEMGKLADALAKCFNIKWTGRGLVNGYKGGYRFQLIYGVGGAENGGNHFNHVHIGVSKQ